MKQELPMLRGVALLLFSNKGKILTLRELVAKPLIRKQAGMKTFPMETLHLGESSRDGVDRLMVEEIGLQFCGHIHKIVFLDEFTFTHPGCITLIDVYRAVSEEEFISTPFDTDVAHHGWLDPTELLEEFVRLEVKTIMETCPNKHKEA
tara:strand:+ start:526 stop:972 length:447 start_codon:yes stop_codon:yes gene_type:complete